MSDIITNGKTLGLLILELIEKRTVARYLPRILASIPEENKHAIINSHFTFKRKYLSTVWQNASPLFIALSLVHELINMNDGRGERVDESQSIEAVRLLLENGADPNIEAPINRLIRDLSPVSMLSVACEKCNLQLVELLVNAGANVNFENNMASKPNEFKPKNALSKLLQSHVSLYHGERGASYNKLEIIQYLYDHGFNLCRAYSERHDKIVDLFTFAATYADTEEIDVALPLILRSCYRNLDMTRNRSGGFYRDRNGDTVPAAFYYKNNLTKEQIKRYTAMYNELIANTENQVIDEPLETIEVEDNAFHDIIDLEDIGVEETKKRGFGLLQQLEDKCPDGTAKYKGTCMTPTYVKSGLKINNNDSEYGTLDVQGNKVPIKIDKWLYKSQNAPEPKTFLLKPTKNLNNPMDPEYYQLKPVNVIEKINNGPMSSASDIWYGITNSAGEVTHYFNINDPESTKIPITNDSNVKISKTMTETEYNNYVSSGSNKKYKKAGSKSRKAGSKSKKARKTHKKYRKTSR